jgi:ABC-type branched-subunit amino acid transport system substrate-binding protein
MALIFRQLAIFPAALILFAGSASAQKQYGPGVSDTEIKIGNIMPYSGPASAYGIIGKTMSAVFRMINDSGGINGRKITFISYDDAYSPPKTVEQARKLVESDEVFLIFAPLCTATNAAIQKYMGILSAGFQMDVTDPQWGGRPGMQRFRAFMAKYYPEADRSQSGPMIAFNASNALVEVLKRCGDNLTRDHVMKVVANLDFEIDGLIPGIRLKTSQPSGQHEQTDG